MNRVNFVLERTKQEGRIQVNFMHRNSLGNHLQVQWKALFRGNKVESNRGSYQKLTLDLRKYTSRWICPSTVSAPPHKHNTYIKTHATCTHTHSTHTTHTDFIPSYSTPTHVYRYITHIHRLAHHTHIPHAHMYTHTHTHHIISHHITSHAQWLGKLRTAAQKYRPAEQKCSCQQGFYFTTSKC